MSVAGFSVDQVLVLPVAILAFVILLTVIVFFHEYGHFSVARLLGVRVDTFSIGFGKPIARWIDRKGTEWRIAMLPLGGYVKFFGDAGPASDRDPEIASAAETSAQPATTQFPQPGRDQEIGQHLTEDERKVCFHFKPVWARAMIVAAGPMANFVLATVIFWGLLIAYGQWIAEPVVGTVVPDSAAEEAGFAVGDRIVSIDGKSIKSFDDMTMITRLSSGEELVFGVLRDGQQMTIEATPARREITSAFGNKSRLGVLGIGADREAVVHQSYGPVSAVIPAMSNVWRIISGTVKFLGRLIFGKEDAREMGGPIKMAQYAGQSVMSGFGDTAEQQDLTYSQRLQTSLANFINLAAIVSVSIGFLNLLPVPVLDGGHLLYYSYEALAGRPLGGKAQAVGFRVGIVLLASFMLFVTWNDINNLLSLAS